MSSNPPFSSLIRGQVFSDDIWLKSMNKVLTPPPDLPHVLSGRHPRGKWVRARVAHALGMAQCPPCHARAATPMLDASHVRYPLTRCAADVPSVRFILLYIRTGMCIRHCAVVPARLPPALALCVSCMPPSVAGLHSSRSAGLKYINSPHFLSSC